MKSGSKNKFTAEDIKIAAIARALGHPARIAIIRHLSGVKTCFFNEISEELPLADSTVSQHMTELKEAGLISGHDQHPKVRYNLNPENFKPIRKYLKGIIKKQKARS